MGETRHLLSILVDNSPGELARIVGLFSGRGFNIDSLAVNTTLESDKSRVVLTTRGDERAVEQITKQLNKLVRVYKVHHLQGENHFERELLLATVRAANSKAREEVERLLNLCSGRVLSFTSSSITLELSATSAEVDHFIEMLRPLGIRNMVRSAPIAISKAMEAELNGIESTLSA